jgi:hypothetical protein
MQINYFQVLYGLHVGFLHQIKPNYRAIAVGYSTGNLIIKVYCDNNPENDDYEILREAISEAEAHIENAGNYSVEIIYSEEPILSLDRLDFWFFLRYDIS